MRKECGDIGHGLVMLRPEEGKLDERGFFEGCLSLPDSKAELTVLRSTFSMEMIAGNTIMKFLNIFKELKLILELLTIWTVSDGSQSCVSCAVAHRLPTLQKDPDSDKFEN